MSPPTYLPQDNKTWHAGTPTENCTICAIQPSELAVDQILDQTWHHGTYFIGTPISVEVTFTGTAVYVYNVVPNTLPGADTQVNISFAIDGETVGTFFHPNDSSSIILYNHLVYSHASLSNTPHTLVMSASGDQESLIFFDYLLFTTDVDNPSSSPTSSTAPTTSSLEPSTAHSPTLSGTTDTGSSIPSASSKSSNTAVIGGAIGGAAALLLVTALIFLYLRRRRRGRILHPNAPSMTTAGESHVLCGPARIASVADAVS